MAHNNKLIFYLIFSIIPKFYFLLFNSSPITDLLPCQFPSSSSQLASFCQLHYHQVPLICDPGGILSRTEAELIDRQLKTQVFKNLTSCICSLRPCIHKDRRLGQLRVFVLLVSFANGNKIYSIKTCQLNQKQNKIPTLSELNRLTGQFARISLDKLLTNSDLEKREKCDPDLFFLYIDSWWTDEKKKQPFIARIYRRNLLNLRNNSLVEQIIKKGNPFEIINGFFKLK
ncbi:hypothetical protein Mgra_00003375 [Meloidogyne graminicola]|uniref:Uncharacterized protein n=1 Tax=Meloidogyne graminicola TaxID=189291 RepID=A0A8S9ZVB3_9BILA|nr:hypothetical protein Mgra_00003375 [Meloidogyne graminicola]